jgi:hypothetical protein
MNSISLEAVARWRADEMLIRQRSPDQLWRYRKPAGEEKNPKKSTYPPPADGLCVRFFCKSRCSANDPAAQPGRGALQAIGNFTKCKVLKGNAAGLHTGKQRGRASGCDKVPGFIGRQLLRRGFRCVFKNAGDLIGAEIGWGQGQAEFPAGHD